MASEKASYNLYPYLWLSQFPYGHVIAIRALATSLNLQLVAVSWGHLIMICDHNRLDYFIFFSQKMLPYLGKVLGYASNSFRTH